MVLLIPYDPFEPFNNLVTAIKCKPDILLIFGNVDVESIRAKYLRKIRHLGLMDTQIRVLACDILDLNSMISVLHDCIAEYGAANCILDATGGDERLLFAAGCVCRSEPIPVVLYSLVKKSFKCLNGDLPEAFRDPDIELTAASRIEINDGQMLHSGHVNSDAMQDGFWEIAERIFFVYMENRAKWPRFTLYMQQLLQQCDATDRDGLSFVGATGFSGGDGRAVQMDLAILRGLMNAGAITEASVQGKRARIKCCSHQIQRALMDAGAWLELYLFKRLKACAEIDDVQLNQVLSWDSDNDHTINELDIIATAGASVFFISCKTGTPNMNMLYEIKTMADRFGGDYSIPVLATACNMSEDAPVLLRRASAMGIVILDAEDLVEKNPAEELMAESRKLLSSYSW